MSSILPRSRRPSSPPSPTSERLVSELRPITDSLATVCDKDSPSIQDALGTTEGLLRLRHTFIDDENPRGAKDIFRQLLGFPTLLRLLQLIGDIYDPTTLSKEDRKGLLLLVKDIHGVLAESLKDHPGNKRYFAKKLDGGGVALLESSLSPLCSKLGQGTAEAATATVDAADVEYLYGGLLAAALGQEMLSDFFTVVRKMVGQEKGSVGSSAVQGAVSKTLGTAETVENKEFIRPFLQLWLAQSSGLEGFPILRLAIPACLAHLAAQSRRNLLTLHSTGILTSLLEIVIDSERNKQERDLYRQLASILCSEGVDSLEDAARLYRAAHGSTDVIKFLLDGIKTSKAPPCIHFDLSRHGYSSVELPALGKAFPPTNSGGYTLAVWARFDNFDPNAHTTIFGAFDPSQACFVLAYLEKDTRNFILQTSVKGARPSVRFKSTAFVTGQWYHICVVHKRPRTGSSSRASLFVNGEFVEQLKSEYPTIPSKPVTQKLARVQAFLGTPEDLATKLGKGVSTSRWSLASAILFDEAFADDIVAVFCHLGPRYHGNFQDCLGSFQTYRASAHLNLRNENLHPGKEEHSDIVAVIRQKASTLIPEASVLLNISPITVLDDNDSNHVDESQLVKSLSKQAARKLNHLIQTGGNAVAINGAVPSINDALAQSYGVATLTGDPVVIVPQSLDDASWRIGACAAPHLSLIEAATTRESTCMAVEALFDAVQDSWRNSEAMERENGYSVLAVLLRDKFGLPPLVQNGTSKSAAAVCSTPEHRNKLAMEMLLLILKFVGYDFDHPNKSIITNPLAYRVLLVDLDIWRFGDLPLLEIYYSQFATFCAESYYRRFNSKRLSRMRVVKKLLDALKGENFTAESMKLFISAFTALVKACMSAENLRSLSLFITYAIHNPKEANTLQKKRSMSFDARAKRPAASLFLDQDKAFLSKPQLGVEALRAYSDIVCKEVGTTNISKFARTVTNKWLLYLLSEDNPEVVVLATTILARLLVTHGSSYMRKFADKSGGFVIMRHRLKRWWHIPALWPVCFAILFGEDVGQLNLERPFDHFGFLDLFTSTGEIKVTFPEVLPVITGMLQTGLKATVIKGSESLSVEIANEPSRSRQNRRSMSSTTPPDAAAINASPKPHIDLLNTIVGFLADIHAKSYHFRDFAVTSTYLQELLSVLFPVIVGSDAVSADVELHSRSSGLTFGTHDMVIRPLSNARPVLRTTTVEHTESPDSGTGFKRGSSFILVSSDKSHHSPSSARLHHSVVPKSKNTKPPPAHSIVQGILELIVSVMIDQILTRKDFLELALHLTTPPGFVEHQTYFQSWVLRNVLTQLKNTILLSRKLLWEPRVLTNLSRLLTHLGDTLYEGWFIEGATSILEFIGPILEYLQQPEISSMKSIRLCSQAISIIRLVVSRTVVLRLSEADDPGSLAFLKKLTYWQTVVLSTEEPHAEYLPLICYLLYSKLVADDEDVRLAAANLWRVLLVQKPSEMSTLLNYASSSLHKRLSSGFQKLVALDDESFLRWVDDQRDDLDSFFFGVLSKHWETFVREENHRIEEITRARLTKRKDKLKQWNQADMAQEEIMRKHDTTFNYWSSNIFSSENIKHQRSLQDQQDNFAFLSSVFARIYRDLRRDNGILAERGETKWRLDQTEGRNRMRLRITPDDTIGSQDYQPKRKALQESSSLKIDTHVRPAGKMPKAPAIAAQPAQDDPRNEAPIEYRPEPQPADSEDKSGLEGSFEIVEDPMGGQEDDYEDKNRKVMRSLHRGDQVQHVFNVSRIEGLEACEALLILGKVSVYILDSFFQRVDGEVVNVWQAPPEERDPYVRMISGHESDDRQENDEQHETRSWKWLEVVSVSKRRFLFRDVALEIFFADGRSYLLTLVSPSLRNELYGHLSSRAPQINGSGNASAADEMWRFEALRNQDDTPQFLRSKIANVFNQNPTHPATRKWIKGEMSNFHYLMIINTMAGRTFNDLTQYPVFPWVLADYTSDELDLTNPKTFRDLSKPMGCQTSEREADYRTRYQSFAEMGDHNAPPFHYGTHYSSAMIVTSYLIRLQPFVKSYLLLQGGTFDHADRLFFSIQKAWESASRVNMTDVRELIPEFFYLPEFLVNSNKYDFGLRQNETESIDNVELPPWAKGDPKIFIDKHREALESPYVTKSLHQWIDLIFGYKQKGEAALEAANVFHHLSYQGAKDLDAIDDPVERLATIGIIHNFGQTPHQAFQKPHPQREEISHKHKRLDTAAESLTRLPFTLLDSQERVASLLFSWKQDRLLCSAAFRLNIPPHYDKYVEWGFSDGSVRFYIADNGRLIGHFEHLHIGQLSGALFADSQTLITSGTDCTVSVWSCTSTSKSVELLPKATLTGHRTLVTTLAVSRSFSTLLSASKEGKIMLWDLNRLEFVRSLPNEGPVDCARINDATGNILVCRGNRISLYTLNGALLIDQAVCEQAEDWILSCAFYEGVSNEWLERELLFTGHKRGLVNIWSKTIRDGRYELDLIRQLHHVDNARGDGAGNVAAGISCILPLAQSVYTGDEVGRVFEWDCVQRH